MARALEPAVECDILRAHPRLTFRAGAYSYEITRRGNTSTYTVTDGHANLSEPILWAFGLGEAGQTYVFKHNGSYYESRVSFFNDTQSSDQAVGRARVPGRQAVLRCLPHAQVLPAGRPFQVH